MAAASNRRFAAEVHTYLTGWLLRWVIPTVPASNHTDRIGHFPMSGCFNWARDKLCGPGDEGQKIEAIRGCGRPVLGDDPAMLQEECARHAETVPLLTT